jgi:hypothetical protein
MLVRYSPYGIDPHVILSLEHIRRDFSNAHTEDAWRIFRTQQKALGRFVRLAREGEFGGEPDTISFWEFERGVQEQAERDDRIRQALDSMKGLDDVRHLDTAVYARLAHGQNDLTQLLEYLEGCESKQLGGPFSLFVGKRKQAPFERPKSGRCHGEEDAPPASRVAPRHRTRAEDP